MARRQRRDYPWRGRPREYLAADLQVGLTPRATVVELVDKCPLVAKSEGQETFIDGVLFWQAGARGRVCAPRYVWGDGRARPARDYKGAWDGRQWPLLGGIVAFEGPPPSEADLFWLFLCQVAQEASLETKDFTGIFDLLSSEFVVLEGWASEDLLVELGLEGLLERDRRSRDLAYITGSQIGHVLKEVVDKKRARWHSKQALRRIERREWPIAEGLVDLFAVSVSFGSWKVYASDEFGMQLFRTLSDPSNHTRLERAFGPRLRNSRDVTMAHRDDVDIRLVQVPTRQPVTAWPKRGGGVAFGVNLCTPTGSYLALLFSDAVADGDRREIMAYEGLILLAGGAAFVTPDLVAPSIMAIVDYMRG